MGTVVMRVPAETHALLARLAKRNGRTLADELAAAVAAYERQQFFDELEAGGPVGGVAGRPGCLDRLSG